MRIWVRNQPSVWVKRGYLGVVRCATLDPDPEKMNTDPQHCYWLVFLFSTQQVLKLTDEREPGSKRFYFSFPFFKFLPFFFSCKPIQSKFCRVLKHTKGDETTVQRVRNQNQKSGSGCLLTTQIRIQESQICGGRDNCSDTDSVNPDPYPGFSLNPEPVLINVYGAPALIPRNEFRQPLAGRYENPIPPRCLVPRDFLKITAQIQTAESRSNTESDPD
jgi:hypothetical protein